MQVSQKFGSHRESGLSNLPAVTATALLHGLSTSTLVYWLPKKLVPRIEHLEYVDITELLPVAKSYHDVDRE